MGRIVVNQRHAQLPAVTRIYDSRRINAGHAVLGGEAAARHYEAGVALGYGDTHTRTHERPSTPRRQRAVADRYEIAARIAFVGVTRHHGTGPQDFRLDFHGRRIPARTRGSRFCSLVTCWYGWTWK